MTELHLGNNLEILRKMASNSVDAVVTDPPYGLGKEPDVLEMLTAWLAGTTVAVGGGRIYG
jgi:DNA modification methylase